MPHGQTLCYERLHSRCLHNFADRFRKVARDSGNRDRSWKCCAEKHLVLQGTLALGNMFTTLNYKSRLIENSGARHMTKGMAIMFSKYYHLCCFQPLCRVLLWSIWFHDSAQLNNSAVWIAHFADRFFDLISESIGIHVRFKVDSE